MAQGAGRPACGVGEFRAVTRAVPTHTSVVRARHVLASPARQGTPTRSVPAKTRTRRDLSKVIKHRPLLYSQELWRAVTGVGWACALAERQGTRLGRHSTWLKHIGSRLRVARVPRRLDDPPHRLTACRPARQSLPNCKHRRVCVLRSRVRTHTRAAAAAAAEKENRGATTRRCSVDASATLFSSKQPALVASGCGARDDSPRLGVEDC